jgi:hypothetical protein|tara:strand:- start:5119 stop:5319 length:201 start_codon:yes stop_codon:yes gene_type:complete
MDLISLSQFIFKIIGNRRDQIGDLLTSGNVKNMEEYRSLVGEIMGMSFVEQELRTVLKNAEMLDDE